MARVFVVAPYVPNGGTFMAYHLARILQQEFGLEGWAVRVNGESPDHGIFDYDPVFPAIDIEHLPDTIGDKDVLIANPSFSAHCLGMRCAGRKVMYIQGYKTFDLLDGHFDLYVSVSGFVRRFIHDLYGLDTEVIPPFIRRELFPPPPPWSDRPAGSVLLHNKGHGQRQPLLLERFRRLVARRRPGLGLEPLPEDKIPQRAYAARLGQARHLLSLSPSEGFGLIPLEAMAMGTTVVAFDAFGGRDYLRPGDNCESVPWPQLEALADRLLDLLDQPERAQALAERGQATAWAPRFALEQFRAAWIAQFERLLGPKR